MRLELPDLVSTVGPNERRLLDTYCACTCSRSIKRGIPTQLLNPTRTAICYLHEMLRKASGCGGPIFVLSRSPLRIAHDREGVDECLEQWTYAVLS